MAPPAQDLLDISEDSIPSFPHEVNPLFHFSRCKINGLPPIKVRISRNILLESPIESAII